MPDEILTIELLNDDDLPLTRLRVAIPREELDQFVSDLEEHFISTYNEAEIL